MVDKLFDHSVETDHIIDITVKGNLIVTPTTLDIFVRRPIIISLLGAAIQLI